MFLNWKNNFQFRYWLLHFIFIITGMLLGAAEVWAAVEVSTATGNTITYDNVTGIATIEGNAMVSNSTATLKADSIFLDTKAKSGRAVGNVKLDQSSATITGSEAEYHWEDSTGVIKNASGEADPWRFSSREARQVSNGVFELGPGDYTTCNETPPHYHLHSNRSSVQLRKRLRLFGPTLVPEDTPIFWMPIYTKSLKPKKYRLRIEPGQNSRDGLTNRTIIGYPYTANSYTDIRWDWLQYTGNGIGVDHRYFAPANKGEFHWYYIRDTNTDPQPQSRRYSILWNHYQSITNQLSLNSKVDFKSDQTIGNQFQNVGNRVLVENQTRGLISEGGLNYQFPLASLQAQFLRQDKFDSNISSKTFVSRVTFPGLIFNTVPLTSKHLPFYTSFNGTYIVDTVPREDPKQSLHYQRRASGGVGIKKDFRWGRNWTFTPSGGYTQNWQNRTVTATTTISEADFYQGNYNTAVDLRRRIKRFMDVTIGHRYQARTRINQAHVDTEADDHGININQVNGSIVSRFGRTTRVSLFSGYDLRSAPKSQPDKYRHATARFQPISLDAEWQIKRDVALYFRETYSLYDQQTQQIIRRPVNTSGELQLGQLTNATFFSQGFSYSQPAQDQPSELFLNNKLKFYLTRKWYVDLFISYRAVADQRMAYSKVFPIQKSIQVVRDLHCWMLRMLFDQRPDKTEVSVYIDLKTNLNPANNVFNQYRGSVYQTRTDELDLSKIFHDEPAPAQSTEPDSKHE